MEGVDNAGDSALRNSVYAEGGVIGVFKSSSSFLMASNRPAAGLFGNAEGRADGRVAVVGVFILGRSGLGDFGVLMIGTSIFSGSLFVWTSVLVSTLVSTSVVDDMLNLE